MVDSIFTTEEIEKDFKNISSQYYHAKIKKTSFPNPGVTEINNFVKQKTDGMINQIVSRVDPSTKLILINTILFKSLWRKKFWKESTKEKDFHLFNSETIKVPMMKQTDSKVRCGEHNIGNFFFESVSKRLENQDFLILFIRPLEINNNEEFEECFDDLINENQKDFIYNTLNLQTFTTLKKLQIPKFRIETNIELTNPLKKMGLSEVFDPKKADFSNMIVGGRPGPAVFISSVIHKAVLEIDEKGVTAAACTSYDGIGSALCFPDGEFILDSPFYCFLVDEKCNTILFSAKVMNPILVK